MKNFILAFLVFLVWGSVSIYYLQASNSFEEYFKYNGKEEFNLVEGPGFIQRAQ